MLRQRRRVIDPCAQRRGAGVLRRLDDPYDRELFPVFHEVFHICLITGLIGPHLVLAVILITVRRVHDAEFSSEDVIIRISPHFVRHRYVLFIHELFDHLVKLKGIPEPQRVEQEIAHSASGCQYKHALIIILRPAPRFHVVLPFIELLIFRHLIKHIRAHHG